MIWVTGDVHGDLRRFQAPPMRRMKRGDSLIICGDFGFLWNGSEEEKKVLDKLGRKKYNILFVEGTHENFDLLESFPVEDFCGGKARRIRDNIFHLMRGQVYTMEGKTFFTFGGGEAEDTLLRKEAGTYWPRSMPNIEEMREGVENLRRGLYHHPFPLSQHFHPAAPVGGGQHPDHLSAGSGKECALSDVVLWQPAYQPQLHRAPPGAVR